jgi:hypothetical protein
VTWAVQGAVRWYADPDTALDPTLKVDADTNSWRTQADRLMGLWADLLVPAHDYDILMGEMLDRFNKWLVDNGHGEWSKESFTPNLLSTTRPPAWRQGYAGAEDAAPLAVRDGP